eukprot:gene8007-8833_t
MSETISPKSFQLELLGVGWGRTGTTSLKQALDILGYPCYHMVDVIERGHAPFWIKVSNQEDHDFSAVFEPTFTAVTDFPAVTYWKELLAAYPKAKVILTIRDPERWYKSCEDTILHVLPSNKSCPWYLRLALFLGFPTARFGEMLEKTFFHDTLHDDLSKENVIRCFVQHIEEVKMICPPHNLLIYDVSDGWSPLCHFLDKPTPPVKFPHTNDTKSFQDMVNRGAHAVLWNSAIIAGVVVLPILAYALRELYTKRLE